MHRVLLEYSNEILEVMLNMTQAERMLLGLFDAAISMQNPFNRTAKQPISVAEFALKQAEMRNTFGNYLFGYVDVSKLYGETCRELTSVCESWQTLL